MLFVPIIAFTEARLSGGNKKRLACPPKDSAFDLGARGTSSLQHTNGHSLIRCELPLTFGGISCYQMQRNKDCSPGGFPSCAQRCPAADAVGPQAFPDPVGSGTEK